jgi:hypothetical protein
MKTEHNGEGNANDIKGYRLARLLVKQGKITKAAHFLYCVLRGYDWKDKGYSFPSEETLAEECNCTVKSIYNHIRQLESVGLIQVDEVGRSNYYHFKADYTAAFEAISPETKVKPAPTHKSPPEPKPEPITPPPQPEAKRPLTDDERATSVFGILQRKFDGNQPLMLDCLFMNEGKIKAKHGLPVYEKIRAKLPATVGTS